MSAVVKPDEVLPSGPPPADPVAHIAVLVSLNFPDMDDTVAELVRRFTRVALATLDELAATFWVLDTSHPLEDPEAVRRCDGLLLLGGGDIDAACYDSSLREVPNSYGIDGRADRDAFAAIGAAEDAHLPVLGICRGAQLINVHRGGTIIPDIADFALHHGGPGEPVFLDERISVLPGTRLSAILGAGSLVGRSGHHQAVATLGEGLVADAVALDGIIEAVEDPARWIVGVQWHPEDDDGPADDRRTLFRAFVEASVSRRRRRQDTRARPSAHDALLTRGMAT